MKKRPRFWEGWSAHTPNDFCEWSAAQWHRSIIRFDDWFNFHFWRLWGGVYQRADDYIQRLRDGENPLMANLFPNPGSEPIQYKAPFDLPAGLLVGLGVGTVAQGYTFPVVFIVWGFARGLRRFVVHRCDDNDIEGLFRFCPLKLQPQRRAAIFHELKREIETCRAIRAGDMRFTDLSHFDNSVATAKDPRLAYEPEAMFADAMDSLVQHPRVQSLLGNSIFVEAEPEQVVYRIQSGKPEVYLTWHVGGDSAAAQVQVKAMANQIDFIYVFPHTGANVSGFAIRPNGAWSLDCNDLPPKFKSAFAEEGGSTHHWDWSIRPFRRDGRGSAKTAKSSSWF